MLLSKDAIADVIEVLAARDFYGRPTRPIFDAILDLYGHGEPADPITVGRRAASAAARSRGSAARPTSTR